VAHPLLELAVAFGACPAVRAEGVAEVVQAERAELGPLLRVLVPAAKGGAVKPAADLVREDQVVWSGEQVSLQRPSKRLSYL